MSVEQGSTVTLYVSSGEETVVVPKLEGMSLAAATEALEKAGCSSARSPSATTRASRRTP